MSFTQLTDHIDELGQHLEAYLSNMVEYYKLDFFKKFMKGFSVLSKLLIVGSLFLFCLGLVSIGFSLWIGTSIGSLSGGFFIVGGVYFVVFIILLVLWKKLIEGIFLEKFSKFIFNESEVEEDLEEIKDEMEGEDAWGRDV